MRRAFFAVLLFAACKDEQPGEGTPYPGCEGVEDATPCGKNGLCNERVIQGVIASPDFARRPVKIIAFATYIVG